MKVDAREATLLSLIAFGAVFGVSVGDSGLVTSLVGAAFTAACAWAAVYALAKRRASVKADDRG